MQIVNCANDNALMDSVMFFNNYRIPRENLLSKTGDVTVDGKYVTSLKDRSIYTLVLLQNNYLTFYNCA